MVHAAGFWAKRERAKPLGGRVGEEEKPLGKGFKISLNGDARECE